MVTLENDKESKDLASMKIPMTRFLNKLIIPAVKASQSSILLQNPQVSTAYICISLQSISNYISASTHSSLVTTKMGRQIGWSVSIIGRLKKAVKKINSFLRLNLTKWRVSCLLKTASIKRRRLSLSFNDRLGLHGCIDHQDEDEQSNERTSVRALQRVASYGAATADHDVDQRAELFISNFHRQLWLEKQVSLELRYYRTRSSLESDTD